MTELEQLKKLVEQLRAEHATLRAENAKLQRDLGSILDKGPDGFATRRYSQSRYDYEDALPWHEDDRY